MPNWTNNKVLTAGGSGCPLAGYQWIIVRPARWSDNLAANRWPAIALLRSGRSSNISGWWQAVLFPGFSFRTMAARRPYRDCAASHGGPNGLLGLRLNQRAWLSSIQVTMALLLVPLIAFSGYLRRMMRSSTSVRVALFSFRRRRWRSWKPGRAFLHYFQVHQHPSTLTSSVAITKRINRTGGQTCACPLLT